MKADLVCQALKSAYWCRKPPAGLIMHSDRGSQYAGDEHRKLIKDYRMIQSMSRRANCWDNAAMETEIGMRNFILDVWFGLLAPANLDADALRILRTVLPKVMRDRGVVTGLETQNIIPASGDAAEMGQMLKRQMDMLPGFMVELGVKPE